MLMPSRAGCRGPPEIRGCPGRSACRPGRRSWRRPPASSAQARAEFMHVDDRLALRSGELQILRACRRPPERGSSKNNRRPLCCVRSSGRNGEQSAASTTSTTDCSAPARSLSSVSLGSGTVSRAGPCRRAASAGDSRAESSCEKSRERKTSSRAASAAGVADQGVSVPVGSMVAELLQVLGATITAADVLLEAPRVGRSRSTRSRSPWTRLDSLAAERFDVDHAEVFLSACRTLDQGAVQRRVELASRSRSALRTSSEAQPSTSRNEMAHQPSGSPGVLRSPVPTLRLLRSDLPEAPAAAKADRPVSARDCPPETGQRQQPPRARARIVDEEAEVGAVSLALCRVFAVYQEYGSPTSSAAADPRR